jgi:DNA-binding NarL/FixJ family response regulator
MNVRSVNWCPACGAVFQPAPDAVSLSLAGMPLPQPIATALSLTPALSSREWTVFRLLGLGFDNRSIACTLHIGERTVKRHVTAVLSKLALESRLQAGLAALALSVSALACHANPSEHGLPAGQSAIAGQVR